MEHGLYLDIVAVGARSKYVKSYAESQSTKILN